MLKHLFLFCSLCLSTYGMSQTLCTPNDTVTTVVYPAPEENGVGGIDKIACKGQPFDFVWTINIPSTITFSGLTAGLDSVVVQQTNGVKNLPAALTYACNPPNCVFAANTKGCIGITGMVDNSVAAGDIELLIATVIHAKAFGGIPVTQPFDLPDPNVTGAGKYFLRVREANDPACSVGTDEQALYISTIQMSPVPATNNLQVELNARIAGDYQMYVIDAQGRFMVQNTLALGQGANTTSVAVTGWASGNYQLVLVKDGHYISRRFQVAE